jgi:hypothetical protein
MKEGLTPGVPTPEKTMKIPVQVDPADVGAPPCVDGSRVNEAEPRLEDVPGGDASAPGFQGILILNRQAAPPWVTRHQLSGPQILWTWGPMSWGYPRVPPSLPVGGRWREAQS